MDELTVRLDAERQRAARRYATIQRALSLVDLGIGALFLVAFVLSGAYVALRDAVSIDSGSRVVVVGTYFLVMWAGIVVLSLPLSVVGGWLLPRRYGLSTQSLGQWGVDWLKGGGIGLALTFVMVEGLYALIVWLPTWWWLIAGLLYLFLVVGLANLGPVLLVPLFFKLTPLAASPLTVRLERLAERANARVRGVYRMNLSAKTTAANAALMGLGNTRRIVIGDTLLDHYATEEIEAVFAHELGHHVHRDVPRLVLGQTVATLVGLYGCSIVLTAAAPTLSIHGIGDVASMPILALVLGAFGLVTTPVANYVSRRMERAADAYALDLTRDPRAFVTAMTRLANQNLAEYDPARWVEVLFYDHPAIARRVRLAEQYAQRTGA